MKLTKVLMQKIITIKFVYSVKNSLCSVVINYDERNSGFVACDFLLDIK